VRHGASPRELFADYLAEQQVDDPRVQRAFDTLLEEVS
jgi:hypothetical protein